MRACLITECDQETALTDDLGVHGAKSSDVVALNIAVFGSASVTRTLNYVWRQLEVLEQGAISSPSHKALKNEKGKSRRSVLSRIFHLTLRSVVRLTPYSILA